jgi:segregation and condensation protein A
VDVLRDVLERLPPEKPAPRGVPRESVRLVDRVQALVEILDRQGQTSFRSLVAAATTRVAVIVEFLAVLELIKTRYLEARQSEAFGDIDLVKVLGGQPPSAEEMADDFTGS